MPVFKDSKIRWIKRYLFQLLPSSLLSSLSSGDLDKLRDYEVGLRDEMFKLEGARMGFYLLMALDEDKFKAITLEALKIDSERSYKRYARQWKGFLRLLFVHAVAPGECEPVPLDTCNRFTGNKTNMLRFMCWEDGWILTTGWRNHFRISPKGAKLVEQCIKMCEREYSEYYISQIELKRSKMGDLAED